MAVKMNGTVYITTGEACKILNFKAPYMFETIYRGNYPGAIMIDDPMPLIEFLRNNGAEDQGLLNEMKKNNRFLIPIEEVLLKKLAVESYRLTAKSKKLNKEVEANG
jgi:hypothetical protein